MQYILIDGSYYIFYRFHAICDWWRMSHKDTPIPDQPIENDEFVEKFKHTFITKIQELPKKLKISDPCTFIVGMDCHRSDIWRNQFFPNYKATRPVYASLGRKNPGPFFELVYKQNLFETAGISHRLYMSQLEADDVIAITTKYLLHAYKDATITIITSDTDYLQLIQPRVQIFNLHHKPVQTEKNSFGCSQKDLFCKIIMGDRSDNIPAIHTKCGKKTAQKYMNNIELFQEKLTEQKISTQFILNELLIDFNKIPDTLQNNMKHQLLDIGL